MGWCKETLLDSFYFHFCINPLCDFTPIILLFFLNLFLCLLIKLVEKVFKSVSDWKAVWLYQIPSSLKGLPSPWPPSNLIYELLNILMVSLKYNFDWGLPETQVELPLLPAMGIHTKYHHVFLNTYKSLKRLIKNKKFIWNNV